MLKLGELVGVDGFAFRVRRETPGKMRRTELAGQVVDDDLPDRECGKCGMTKWKFDGGAYEGRVRERSPRGGALSLQEL